MGGERVLRSEMRCRWESLFVEACVAACQVRACVEGGTDGSSETVRLAAPQQSTPPIATTIVFTAPAGWA